MSISVAIRAVCFGAPGVLMSELCFLATGTAMWVSPNVFEGKRLVAKCSKTRENFCIWRFPVSDFVEFDRNRDGSEEFRFLFDSDEFCVDVQCLNFGFGYSEDIGEVFCERRKIRVWSDFGDCDCDDIGGDVGPFSVYFELLPFMDDRDSLEFIE
jgi:hypothetical protein